MGARLSARWRLALPLLLPSLGGLCYLFAFGAPVQLIAVNAGALVLAIVWMLLGQLPSATSVRIGIAAGLALALFVPPVTGPDLGGVTRWFPAGPVILQSGPLLLPLLVVLAASDARRGPLLLGVATVALALQPDAASLLAVALASTAMAVLSRSLAFVLIGAAAMVFAVLTIHAGALAPQLYTEGVLAHVAERSLVQAAILGALLFVLPLWHLVTKPDHSVEEGAALAALLIGLGAAAMIAPFPFPLIGYGASPILGFGIALGAIAAHRLS